MVSILQAFINYLILFFRRLIPTYWHKPETLIPISFLSTYIISYNFHLISMPKFLYNYVGFSFDNNTCHEIIFETIYITNWMALPWQAEPVRFAQRLDAQCQPGRAMTSVEPVISVIDSISVRILQQGWCQRTTDGMVFKSKLSDREKCNALICRRLSSLFM